MNESSGTWNARTSAVLTVVALAAAVGMTLWIGHSRGPTSERTLFWGLVVPWSIVARFPGAAVGGWLGRVSRHAVAWFAAVIAGALAILIFNFSQEPDLLLMLTRLRTGLIPPAIVFAILAATIAETSLCLLEMLWPRRSKS